MMVPLRVAAFLAALCCFRASLACEHEDESCSSRLMSGTAEEGSSLLSLSRSVAPRGHAQTCTPLTNRGTHSTVDIEVGTPSQRFTVVADTGSNSIVIPSCLCQTAGGCSTEDRCFVGTNTSSTFFINMSQSEPPPELLVTYGSGSIYAVVANDVVKVGDISAKMDDGILLMTENALTLPAGVFEGILGLGVPIQKDLLPTNQTQEVMQEPRLATDVTEDIMKEWMKNMCGEGMDGLGESTPDGQSHEPKYYQRAAPSLIQEQSAMRSEVMRRLQDRAVEMAVAGRRTGGISEMQRQEPVEEPPSFLEQAGVDRFSICFNDGADGVLRLGTPALEKPLGSIGATHWALDFRGISVGSGKKPAALTFCHPENTTDPACAAIPDSGTTLIMGPYEQIVELFESICDQWDRCAKNYTALESAQHLMTEVAMKEYGIMPWDLKMPSKAEVFEAVLYDCESWLDADHNLDDELPPVHFHMNGAANKKTNKSNSDTLTLKGWSYVMERAKEPAKPDKQDSSEFGSLMSNETQEATPAAAQRFCSPAFSALNEVTSAHGPLWILGTPLFYDFEVQYDLGTKPPTVQFREVSADAPCGSCSHEPSSLGQTDNTQGSGIRQRTRSQGPRRIVGEPRKPSWL
mmetsp:Transcript_58175/g.138504  ORF Transcript_58175/g.138504 Transcript_58175/m.138504 type:complete len:632 (+) Transcript_58175:92-1987(+)